MMHFQRDDFIGEYANGEPFTYEEGSEGWDANPSRDNSNKIQVGIEM
jgi:hypothetical protein